MKSVTVLLGGAQILLGLSYDIQDIFEEYLTDEHRSFLGMLRIIENGLPDTHSGPGSRGRRPYSDLPMLRAFLSKSFFRIDATSDLIRRLESDRSLRQICGFSEVPSQATFSRRLNYFARINLMEQFGRTPN